MSPQQLLGRLLLLTQRRSQNHGDRPPLLSAPNTTAAECYTKSLIQSWPHPQDGRRSVNKARVYDSLTRFEACISRRFSYFLSLTPSLSPFSELCSIRPEAKYHGSQLPDPGKTVGDISQRLQYQINNSYPGPKPLFQQFRRIHFR